MLYSWKALRRWRRERWLRRHPLPDRLWEETVSDVPLLRRLDAVDRARARELATVFMQEKRWLAAHALDLDDAMRARIAGIAVIPLLGLDLDWYRGWETVIVYPGEFVHRREEVDAAGLVHEWDEVLGGEAWERGPVILSWLDVLASGRLDGYNVVLHELAHKLDMLNGPPDGFPPLHRGMDVRAWTEAFTRAYDDLNDRLDRGETPPVDPYAAEHPSEFFAVLCEYFFEQPILLEAAWPAVYGQLREFFRQDPLRWWGRPP